MTGQQLSAYLELKGIKRSDVSAKLGMTRQHIYSLLNSPNITTSSLEDVAKAIGVRPSAIYRFVEKLPRNLENKK
jgi:transcriptional regulator with XRE-family HTH domain